MPRFKISDLSDETKIMHDSQKIWRNRNWKTTLGKHEGEIKELIEKINLFDIWSNKLRDVPAAKILIREIFMDAYVSIHFASYGLYKYAHTCLRSELETALRLVYFSTHKTEFKWWFEGNEWYREKLNWPDVWGRGYDYFKQLDEIKKFEDLCEDNKKLFGGKHTGVSRVYKKLSRFIHSGAEQFQTRTDRVSPTYDSEKFIEWRETYDKVQIYIHIILSLGFPKEFKGMQPAKRNKILDIGMNTDYKDKVKQVLDVYVSER